MGEIWVQIWGSPRDPHQILTVIYCKSTYLLHEYTLPTHSVRMTHRENKFWTRTFKFSKAQFDRIRATCTEDNVRGLNSGRWRTNDGNSRRNHKGTLDLARAGELAVESLISHMIRTQPNLRHWTVGSPDFTLRPMGEQDRGDIPINRGHGPEMIEVKTTTNKGAHNLHNCTRTARRNGYSFQKQIWNYRQNCRVLTATFDPNSDNYASANARLLVGCVGTYSKDGGAMITVSDSTFLLPVSECKWAPRRYYARGDEDLKAVHYDTKFI